jgi:hypothetical protein
MRTGTAEPRFQSRVNSCEIHGRGSSTRVGFTPNSLCFLLLIPIPPLLHPQLLLPPDMCDRPDHAAHYHILVHLWPWDPLL